MHLRSIKRRSGAVILTDAQTGKISGIFSDGDLRRLILHDEDAALRRPVREVMTANPKRIRGDALASEAMAILRQYRIDDLPVVDDDDRPIGLIDVQDLVVLEGDLGRHLLLHDLAEETRHGPSSLPPPGGVGDCPGRRFSRPARARLAPRAQTLAARVRRWCCPVR